MIKFEMHEKLSNHVIEALWEQEVNMDDWDYVLFVENEYKNQFIEERDGTLTPKNYDVEHLLHGCCDNKWYSVTDFFGKPGIIGVAYHA